MKKFLSILLAAVVMMTSVFCVSAFAAEAPKADALLDRLETEDEVLVTIDSGSTMLFGFLPSDIKNTVAVKGNSIAYEYTAGFLKVRIIASENGIYAFIPTLPYFYVKLDRNPLEGADIWQLVKDAANLTQGFIQYIDSYNETVDGKEYPFEEISAVTVLGKNKVNLYVGKQLYQLQGDARFNGLKYVNIYHRHKNIAKGNEHDKFLGL